MHAMPVIKLWAVVCLYECARFNLMERFKYVHKITHAGLPTKKLQSDKFRKHPCID